MSRSYPTPDIQLFLARIEGSLRPIFSPAQLKKYQAAVDAVFLNSAPFDIAGKALQKIEADYPGSDNWHASFFSDVYGGIRSPAASANRLSLRLKPPVPPPSADPQIYSAARYLRAVGIWAIHLHDGQTFTPLQKVLKHQMDGYLCTFRYPGSKTDELYTFPITDDVNAAVFYRGVPHLVQIARSRVVLSIEAISAQLTAVKARKVPSDVLPIAAYSWRLGRTEWHHAYQQLLGVGENGSQFELLKTSAVSVALDGESPATTPEFMEDVREGTHSTNRYADQTFIVVVYQGGEVGLNVDHAPADCGALIELATILGSVLGSDRFPQCTDAASPRTLFFKHPKEHLPELPSKYEEALKRIVTTFDLPPPPDASLRPSDALLNITFQTALLAARPGFMQPIYQPVHQRDFVGGRTDAMWPISEESTALVRRLISIGGVPTDASQLKELRGLLGGAIEKRRKLIDLSRSGKAPHMFKYGFLQWTMQNVLTDESVPEDFRQSVRTVLDAWSKTSGSNALPSSPTDDTIAPVTEKFGTIQFTGLTLPEHDPTFGEYPLEGDILGGLGNIYLPDQLALLYIVRPDRSVAINLSAGGHFGEEAQSIQRAMEVWYPKVVRLWTKE